MSVPGAGWPRRRVLTAALAATAAGRSGCWQTGCDRAVVNYGTNDLGAGHGADAVKASLAAVWALLAGCGVRHIYQATLLPRTRSAAGYDREADQAPVLQPGQRETVNAWLRVPGHPAWPACWTRPRPWNRTGPGGRTRDR